MIEFDDVSCLVHSILLCGEYHTLCDTWSCRFFFFPLGTTGDPGSVCGTIGLQDDYFWRSIAFSGWGILGWGLTMQRALHHLSCREKLVCCDGQCLCVNICLPQTLVARECIWRMLGSAPLGCSEGHYEAEAAPLSASAFVSCGLQRKL